MSDKQVREEKHAAEPISVSAGKRFFGLRAKLIAIFIVIKVVPLVAIALFAAHQINVLGRAVKGESKEIVKDTRQLVSLLGTLVSEDSIEALDLKSRQSIERLTTDTAAKVAGFLYERDRDILLAANLPVEILQYKQFLAVKTGTVTYHDKWVQNDEGTGWLRPTAANDLTPMVRVSTTDNKKEFHYRRPASSANKVSQPLYHEMTFVDLSGEEKIKISATGLLGKQLRDVSKKENTWCKAENYFAELQGLKKGEVYVSNVIGPYISSPLIGTYSRVRAKAKNIPFAPEKAAYAGKENPVGKRFQGIIRWATPVFVDGKKTGYVTLALDHTQVMEFTDHIVPTEERFSDISDAGSGNYAFMWDYKGRNISHPRDYFIVGYDPQTGEQAVPWLSKELYDLWLVLGKSFEKFAQVAPQFQEQSLEKKPALPLIKDGMLGLDCRYLNFAPQCSGWNNLTQYGGSGSFVIFWSNLWKLTTAAAIPYYTGMYGQSPRGFGYVTIGADVKAFHSAATKTAAQIEGLTEKYEADIDQKNSNTLQMLDNLLQNTVKNLSVSTGVMIVLVVFIAIWMASTLTAKITAIISGIKRFQSGHLTSRLEVVSNDEVGQLTEAFNEMSDTIQQSIEDIGRERDRAEEADKAKSLFLANMSHEIRTPMSAIIGMSNLAFEASENAEQRKLLNSVKTSAAALLAVVNDVLDFSKIEAGQLDLETHPFVIRKLLDSVMRPVSVLAMEKNVEIVLEVSDQVPEVLCGDNQRLRQILLNLLGNGVKFTEQGTVSLEVRAEGQTEEECEVLFIVRDTGIGLKPDQFEMIFDSFSQSDNSLSRKHQGTGLGLAISRKLCRLMGGDISVTSEPGLGSTFSFSLAFSLLDSAAIAAESSSLKSLQVTNPALNILLVEDNEANRELGQMMLNQDNHTVITAVNGIDALEKIGFGDDWFDIVLMDIQMPEMDGFTATAIIRLCETGKPNNYIIDDELERRLRSKLYGQHQPIVALTAHAMRGDKERCLMAGMDDYLTKPFVRGQVAVVLNRLVITAGAKVKDIESGDYRLRRQASENLKTAYALDDEKIAKLLVTTIAIVKKDVAKLIAAAKKGDKKTVKMTSHSIKGVLLNMGLNDEASLAAKIDREGGASETDVVVGWSEELSDVLKSLLN